MRLSNLKYISVILFMVAYGCSKREYLTQDDLNAYKKAQNDLSLYYVSKDTLYLNKAFSVLEATVDYQKNGLTDRNYILASAILLNSKKYSELLHGVQNYSGLDKYKKQVQENLLQYLISAEQHKNATKYLIANIDYITQAITENPADSTKLFDLYTMKYYLNGINEALTEIDNSKLNNPVFSTKFYEELTEYLLEYYKSFPVDSH